jgi:hypothetical protein
MKLSSKHFRLLKSPNSDYTFVCFSMDSVRPDVYLDDLATEVSKKVADGQILLDLLTCNGDSSRRFVTVQISGNKLKWSSAKVTPRATLERALVGFCANFYANHLEALKQSVLSSAARHRIGLGEAEHA